MAGSAGGDVAGGHLTCFPVPGNAAEDPQNTLNPWQAAGVMAAMQKETFLRELLGRMSLVEKAGQLNLLAGGMDSTGMKNPEHLEQKIRDGRCGAVFNVFTPAATRALQELALASPNAIPA